MDKPEQARELLNQGFSCSQSVLLTYAKNLGLEHDSALKVSSAFGGGMARMGNICGAVTGAFMVIGLKYGSTRPDDTIAKDKISDLGKEFVRTFSGRYGSILCKDLLGTDISSQDGLFQAREKGLFTTLCPVFVKGSVEILEEKLLKQTEEK